MKYKIQQIAVSSVAKVSYVSEERAVELEDDEQAKAMAAEELSILSETMTSVRVVRLNESSTENNELWDEVVLLPKD